MLSLTKLLIGYCNKTLINNKSLTKNLIIHFYHAPPKSFE